MHDTNTNLPNNSFDNGDSDSNDDLYNASQNKKKTMNKNGAIGHLPTELLEFVNNDTFSLLIKGTPGTGKTTLALTLMDNLNYDSNYFYISTRLSIRQLLYFYPWITKFTLNNKSNLEYKFEDARLDEPESLFERITNQLMDVKSPIIIIDTWDAIALFMDRESRLNNERVLQIWRERAGAKLIFLTESPDLTLLDSIVDGVITLKQELKKSYTYRELHFNKLRGISIYSPKYHFSLHHGIFFSLDSTTDLNLMEKFRTSGPKHNGFVIKETIGSQINKDRPYPSQDTFLNELINKSNITTMEFDSRMPNELILSMLSGPLFSWVVSGRRISISNFEWNFYSVIKRFLLFLASPKLVDDLLLNEKLDLFKIYKEYFVSNEQINSVEEGNCNLDESEVSISKAISDVLKKTGKNINHDSVLNIIDGNNTIRLFSDFKFIDSLKRNSHIHNLIIIKKNRFPKQDYNNNNNNNNNHPLLSEGNFFKIVFEGKNIMLKSVNPSKQIYGAYVENNGLFVGWYPLT